MYLFTLLNTPFPTVYLFEFFIIQTTNMRLTSVLTDQKKKCAEILTIKVFRNKLFTFSH